MRGRALVLFFVVLSISLLACKKKIPKAGDLCTKEGTSMCAGPTKRFICSNGHYVEETCVTCTESKGFGSSTISYSGCYAGGVGPEGAECYAQSSADCDGTDLVKCVDGHYRHYPCGGPLACTHVPVDGVLCDASVGAAGAACRKEGEGACSADRKSIAHCRNGKLVTDLTCKGPKGCTVEDKGTTQTISCDTSLSDVGDACTQGGSCSSDKRSILECRDGRYAVYQKCRGADPTCEKTGDLWHCAVPGAAEVGDPCTGTSAACTGNAKGFLECKNGVYAQTGKCSSCSLSGTTVTCRH